MPFRRSQLEVRLVTRTRWSAAGDAFCPSTPIGRLTWVCPRAPARVAARNSATVTLASRDETSSLSARLREALQVELSVETFFERASVAELALAITEQRDPDELERTAELFLLVQGLPDDAVERLLRGQPEG